MWYCSSGKRENIQKLNDIKKFLFVVIVSVAKVLPSICNVAKEGYLTSSVQNSLVPLGEILHGWTSKYYKLRALKITKSLHEFFLGHVVEIWGWNLREGAPTSLIQYNTVFFIERRWRNYPDELSNLRPCASSIIIFIYASTNLYDRVL